MTLNPYRFYRNKYHNKSCSCASGHMHQSRLEAGYCTDLKVLLDAGEIKGYRIQVPFDLCVNGSKITRYYADFVVEDNDGKEAIHEVKGFATDVYRIKRKLFEALHPEVSFFEIH